MKNDTSFYEKQAVVYEEEDVSVFHDFIIMAPKRYSPWLVHVFFLGEN